MQMDLKTVSIKPLRNTYGPVADFLGGDKPASRYLEGTIGIQVEDNFHYRPLWDPDHEIFDKGRTAIKMQNWNRLIDPRQFYYGTYTLARARMQEKAEADFEFVEERGLGDMMPPDLRQLALDVLLPLRHVEWGSNMNNSYICSYAWGAAIATPCIYQAMDHLGMAQYLTRLGLAVDDVPALERAKAAWLNDAKWQGLRQFLEDSFVTQDWFEVFVANNLVLDGLLYPLVYGQIDTVFNERGGPVISMLTRFQSEWFAENSKWVDALIKTACAESTENRNQLSAWTATYLAKATAALKPIAEFALGDKAETGFDLVLQKFGDRVGKLGLVA